MLFVTFFGGSSFAGSDNLASKAAGEITAGVAVLPTGADTGCGYYCCCWTSMDEEVARLLILF